MNGLDIHLLVNHIPVIGIPIGVLVALGGMLFKAEAVKKTGLIIFIATGVLSSRQTSAARTQRTSSKTTSSGSHTTRSMNTKKQQRLQ